jgi:hypothetical protein
MFSRSIFSGRTLARPYCFKKYLKFQSQAIVKLELEFAIFYNK